MLKVGCDPAAGTMSGNRSRAVNWTLRDVLFRENVSVIRRVLAENFQASGRAMAPPSPYGAEPTSLKG
jgi:hypothetical protein